jgi:hypothetical protein
MINDFDESDVIDKALMVDKTADNGSGADADGEAAATSRRWWSEMRTTTMDNGNS